MLVVVRAIGRLRLTELPPGGAPSLLETLEHQAAIALRAHEAGDEEVATLLRGHGMEAGTKEAILGARLTLDRARMLVAREHGFRDWSEVIANGGVTIDRDFEAAVDAVIEGDVAALGRRLRATPALARARSAYPHRATLLHHVAANGIEHTRQRASPSNAPEVATLLLAAGGEPDATCEIYGGGGGSTPLCLLVSSVHPAVAGVQAEVAEVLCAGGAKVDGVDDDGAPLWTAALFGYTPAFERIARCGARVDNVVFAAVLGDLARVEALTDAPPAESARSIGVRGPALDPKHLVEYAHIYACGHGRREVVEFLLTRGPDLSVKEPFWSSTALGMARHRRQDAIARLLERS